MENLRVFTDLLPLNDRGIRGSMPNIILLNACCNTLNDFAG